MIGAKAVGLLILSSLLTLPAGGQQPANNGSAPHPQQQQKNTGERPVGRLGDWLDAHKDVPLDQQEKLVQSDPTFKRLPAPRQAALLESLRKFNSLPPAEKKRELRNMKYWESLTPDQRKQIKEAHQHMQTLPAERKTMVRHELRTLLHMSSGARQQELQSDKFKSTFSDQEQTILKNLSDINPPAQ